MDEEKKDFIAREPSMTSLAKQLSGMSRDAGTVGFMIKYSATKGNIGVHEAFIRYAFEEANNEYLVAIDKLLQNARFVEYFRELDERISRLEERGSEERGKVSEDSSFKTF